VSDKYIEFVNPDENIDSDEKMKNLKAEFANLSKSVWQSKKDVLDVF